MHFYESFEYLQKTCKYDESLNLLYERKFLRKIIEIDLVIILSHP